MPTQEIPRAGPLISLPASIFLFLSVLILAAIFAMGIMWTIAEVQISEQNTEIRIQTALSEGLAYQEFAKNNPGMPVSCILWNESYPRPECVGRKL